MLHVRLRRRQVNGWLYAILLAVATAGLAPATADAARADQLATADELARSGQSAEAATLYESLAKKIFGRWDPRLALLAAHEYAAAGQLDDAERMLAIGRERARDDDAVLLARVQAEVSLARGQPSAAISAIAAVPEPWPPAVAAELLALRAQAEFAAGQTLAGVRTLDQRARLAGAGIDRRENDAMLVEGLLQRPGSLKDVPAGASAEERGWFELGELLSLRDTDAAASNRQAVDWRARHPGHPGAAFLPQPAAEALPVVPDRGSAAAALAYSGVPGKIALLLPLSGRQGAAGLAVRDGFLAAALAESPERRARVEIYDTAALGVRAAYADAVAAGANAIAGPLTKEDVADLVAGPPLALPTLALNAVPDPSPPAFLFQFSLDPEQEARAAARRIAEAGYRRGIALYPRNGWGDRLQQAFSSELRELDIALTAEQFYDQSARDFSGPLRSALGRYGGAGDRNAAGTLARRDGAAEALDGPQFAFVAASAATARAIRPQLRFQMAYDLPVYATSDAWDPGSGAVPDLDGMRFPEMPWILQGGQGAPGLWAALQGGQLAADRGRLRLYAFGYDAYQLLRGLNVAARGVPVDGLTGRLTILADGRVVRELQWARIVDGREEVDGGAFAPLAPLAAPGEP